MNSSSPPHRDSGKTTQPHQQPNLPRNHGETSNPTPKDESSNMQHDLGRNQTDAPHAGPSNPSTFFYNRSGHVNPGARSTVVGTEISHIVALTQLNLLQLQNSLARQSPLARWESESVKTGPWNTLGKVPVQEDAARVAPQGQGALKGHGANP